MYYKHNDEKHFGDDSSDGWDKCRTHSMKHFTISLISLINIFAVLKNFLTFASENNNELTWSALQAELHRAFVLKQMLCLFFLEKYRRDVALKAGRSQP